MRSEINRVGVKAGLRFIVNTVLDGSDCIAGVFAGEPVLAHKEGVRFAQGI